MVDQRGSEDDVTPEKAGGRKPFGWLFVLLAVVAFAVSQLWVKVTYLEGWHRIAEIPLSVLAATLFFVAVLIILLKLKLISDVQGAVMWYPIGALAMVIAFVPVATAEGWVSRLSKQIWPEMAGTRQSGLAPKDWAKIFGGSPAGAQKSEQEGAAKTDGEMLLKIFEDSNKRAQHSPAKNGDKHKPDGSVRQASANEKVYQASGGGRCRLIFPTLGWQRVELSGTGSVGVSFDVDWTVDKALSTSADEAGHAAKEMSTLRSRKKEKYAAKYHFGALLMRQGDEVYPANWVSKRRLSNRDGYVDFRTNEKDAYLSDNAGIAVIAFGDRDAAKDCRRRWEANVRDLHLR